MPARQPQSLTICSYQVGFGDCFLLSFDYGTFKRHVLVDFGSTSRPKPSSPKLMLQVAQDIEAQTGGKLHAVVATHRHRDHISGFGGKTGKIIQSLKPDVVIQPWTEDPKAEVDALKAKQTVQKNLTPLHTLTNMDRIATQAVAVAKSIGRYDRALAERLQFLGEDNVKNKAAVKGLMAMGKAQRYVREGNSAGLGRLLPGVKVHILGPPSLTQTRKIRKQTHRNDEEFWHLQANAGDLAEKGKPLFPRSPTLGEPTYGVWFQRRMRSLKMDQMLELVLQLDHALNNTSVILLFETRGKKFLFPGDAQWENWQHALGKKKYEKLLKDVDVYKVGHHGSLNATPKSLWKLFQNRSTTASDDRLTSLLSTMADKHGHEENKTEVPRRTLLRALRRETDLLNTQKLKVGEVHEIVFDF